MLLLLLSSLAPSGAVAAPGKVLLDHALRVGEPAGFWSAWPDVDEAERDARSAAVTAWGKELARYGSLVLLAAPDQALAAMDVLLPQPSQPIRAHTVALDHVIGLLRTSGLDIALEIRPSAEPLGPPEDLTAFLRWTRSLAERYDGDTDFGIPIPGATDDLPYPDINGTFEVNSSDWNGTEPQEKTEWAATHTLTTFTLASGFDPAVDSAAEQAPWIAAAAKAILEGSPGARVLVGPLPLSTLKKGGRLRTLLADALLIDPMPVAGILVDIDLPISASDLGGEDLVSAMSNARSVLRGLHPDLGLLVAGLQVPARPHEGALWIRPCPSKAVCNADLQAQILVKSLVRLLGAGHGAGLSEPFAVGEDGPPGPLASVEGSWRKGRFAATVAGRGWLRARQILSGTPEEIAAPVLNIRLFRTGGDSLDTTWLLWWDWWRETPPPYSGIEKAVALEAPAGARRAMLRDLLADPSTPDSSSTALPDPEIAEIADGKLNLRLKDRILVVSFDDQAPQQEDAGANADADAADSEDARAPGADGGAGDGSGGGCSAAAEPWPLGWLLLLALLTLMSRAKGSYVTSESRRPFFRR